MNTTSSNSSPIVDLMREINEFNSRCLKNKEYEKKLEDCTLTNTILESRNELDQKISDLRKQKEQVKKLYESCEQKYKSYTSTNAETQNETTKYKKVLQVLVSNLESKIKEIDDTKRKGEPSQRDKEMLEKAKKKLSLFKEITRTTFDYKTPETVCVQGYIKKLNNAGVKVFKYKGNMGAEEISQQLWDELTKIAEETTSNKENICLKNQN